MNSILHPLFIGFLVLLASALFVEGISYLIHRYPKLMGIFANLFLFLVTLLMAWLVGHVILTFWG